MTNSSPTIVSELNADVPLSPSFGSITHSDLPLIKSDSIEIIELNKIDSPVIRLKKQLKETISSPDSETSSHFTSTTSSSGNLDIERLERLDVSSSSANITSADETPKGESGGSGVKEAQTLSETASFGSVFSSPSSYRRKSSDSSRDEAKTASPEPENVS